MASITLVDTKEQLDAVTRALKAAGFADSNVVALQCENVMPVLERLQSPLSFCHRDDAIIELSIMDLDAGHIALGVKAKDRAGARRFASRSEPRDPGDFSYAWVNERLSM